MKSIFNTSALLGIILSGLIINSCVKEEVPILTTTALTDITGTTATSGGSIIEEGSSTVINRGVCWSTGTEPTLADNKTSDGAGAGSFTSRITGLDGATIYFVRAYATNSFGTGYGMAMSLKTLGQSPTPTVEAATKVTLTSATLNGTVNANYLSTVVTFEYGITTSYGSMVTATPSPVTGYIYIKVNASITGLKEGTIYHYRIKAVNSLGTTYGSDMTFTTQTTPRFNPNLAYGTITDIEGNVYKTITIGTQTWMAENLKTTKYNDGTAIPNIIVASTWGLATTGMYSDYDNTPEYSTIYGRLYNWYAADNNVATRVASNGGKNVCPTNWHVPTNAEWTTLTTYLGGDTVAGGKLKETGTTHWLSPNTGATNETGFTALPGGHRKNYGEYSSIGYSGGWLSSTEYAAAYGCVWGGMGYNNNDLVRGYSDKPSGFSVRCVKD